MAAILSFLLQDLQESCQSIAVSSGGKTGYRLGAHRGQLDAHTPAATRLTVSKAVVDFQVRLPRPDQHRSFGHLGLSQIPHRTTRSGRSWTVSSVSSKGSSKMSTTTNGSNWSETGVRVRSKMLPCWTTWCISGSSLLLLLHGLADRDLRGHHHR